MVTDPDLPEEISSGPEREPRWAPAGQLPRQVVALRSRCEQARAAGARLWARGVRLRRVGAGMALAVVTAAAVWVVDSPPPSGPGSAGRHAPSASPETPVAAGQQYVEVGEVCPPQTDGVGVLVVSFTLRNISGGPVSVRSVQPLLPLGGLDAVSTDISGGTCAATTGAPADLDLPVDGTLVVTFRFLLPGTCPQALPIQARTTILVGPALSVGAGEAPAVSLVNHDAGVLADLGAIRFADCPAAT